MEKAEEQERTERNWVKDEQEKAFQVRKRGGGSYPFRRPFQEGVGLEIKSNNSADPVNGAGGPAEGPGARGCLEGGRGGEQASRAGLLLA